MELEFFLFPDARVQCQRTVILHCDPDHPDEEEEFPCPDPAQARVRIHGEDFYLCAGHLRSVRAIYESGEEE